jgi:hypothetical protein
MPSGRVEIVWPPQLLHRSRLPASGTVRVSGSRSRAKNREARAARATSMSPLNDDPVQRLFQQIQLEPSANTMRLTTARTSAERPQLAHAAMTERTPFKRMLASVIGSKPRIKVHP